MIKIVNGVEVEMTEDEVLAWEAEQAAYTPPDPWIAIRAQRDALLKETDWYALRAWEQGTPMPPGVAEYRQSLRDITEQEDPANVVWPTLNLPENTPMEEELDEPRVQ